MGATPDKGVLFVTIITFHFNFWVKITYPFLQYIIIIHMTTSANLQNSAKLLEVPNIKTKSEFCSALYIFKTVSEIINFHNRKFGQSFYALGGGMAIVFLNQISHH